MPDQGQRTEQPTPRRLEKARREGQFPASRELVASFTFLGFVWMATATAGSLLGQWRSSIRYFLEQAFRIEVTPLAVIRLMEWVGLQHLAVWVAAGLLLSAGAFGFHWVSTGFGLAWKKLAPDFTRLNPLPRLGQLPGQNLSAFFKALILLPVFAWVVYRVARDNFASFLVFPRMPHEQAVLVVGRSLADLLWKAAFVFVLLGAIDYFRQRRRWMSQMRMTKQEVREEHKEVEGNPLIRMRIRRLQRELLRRRMMEQVPKATAVIVNPTHYAVAIRYQMETMAAPKVVAKGKNWLAQRIREVAVRHQVPVVENPPLAQALYTSAEVGQEIPPALYQAVAEILAYIYRLLRGNLPG
ncbi:MAG: EscU/YscU/HrcU family type III secretion system export apparatus switch protein [Acidobacteria bacterium]|nr:EscU/YscU/HrcU family type III secretion system export apparatus switch protein [Acidobacteriota bacterium]